MDYNNRNKSQVEGLKAVEEIPCFDESIYFYKSISRQAMYSLPILAKTIGWKKAIIEGADPSLANYVTSPRRTFFFPILEINEEDKVLDAGSGWGNISAKIAKGFPTTQVYALDRSNSASSFANSISKQEHIDNMYVVHADIMHSPFGKNSFDVVIMLGLLEWLGMAEQNSSPRTSQILVLRRIYDMLRPGGRLLIGAENRFAHRFFIGARDSQSGLRFITLFPRQLANFYSRYKNKTSYRTYTYSEKGYRQLLRESGFIDPIFYAAIPDYQYPTTICDLKSVKEIAHYRIAKAIPRSIVGALAGSFYIKARREPNVNRNCSE
jgi:ubiquinone/menaquinone biosynthesis C-methylase UbiE